MTSPRRRKNPHVVPPPPVEPEWRTEIDALREVGGDLPLTLWRALRSVREWAEVPPEAREGMFPPPTPVVRERFACAMEERPELMEALGLFVFLLRHPDVVEGRQVAEACHYVYAWAEERSMTLTAVHFAEAAALADPENAARANVAARMCRRAAHHHRAAAWYRRAYKLAVRVKDRNESLGALIGYAYLLQCTGRFSEACELYQRAARRAERTGRRRQAAKAHQDLFALFAEMGRFDEAEEHMLHALEIFPSRHERFPAFAHDVGFYLVRRKFYLPALLLLERVPQLIRREEERVLVWSTLAWAAAGAGKVQRFREVEERVIRSCGVSDEFSPGSLLNLAEGARALGEWDKAESYAAAVIREARQREWEEPARRAEILRVEIEKRTSVREELPLFDADRLVRRIHRQLKRWRALNRS